jgi:hypothetical protein
MSADRVGILSEMLDTLQQLGREAVQPREALRAVEDFRLGTAR